MHGEDKSRNRKIHFQRVRIILMTLIEKSISSRWILEIILNESRENTNKNKINLSKDVYKHVDGICIYFNMLRPHQRI